MSDLQKICERAAIDAAIVNAATAAGCANPARFPTLVDRRGLRFDAVTRRVLGAAEAVRGTIRSFPGIDQDGRGGGSPQSIPRARETPWQSLAAAAERGNPMAAAERDYIRVFGRQRM